MLEGRNPPGGGQPNGSAADPRKAKRRRWYFVALKVFIAAIVLWGIRRALGSAFDQIREQWAEGSYRLRPLWLAASAAIYLAAFVPPAMFWRRALQAVGRRPRFWETLRAYSIGHLGKYVPGKAMVVVLRTGLIRSGSESTAAVAVTVFFETLTMMAVGGFIAAAVLAVGFRDQRLLMAAAIASMLVAGLPTLPPVFRRLARIAGAVRRSPEAAERLERMGYGALAAGWIGMSAAWVLMGLSLWMALLGIGQDPPDPLTHWPHYTACVALATVAGFVSFIPGGAIVRELVLLEMSPLLLGLDPGSALVSALVLRLVWLVAEVGISAILYPVGLRMPVSPDQSG